MSLNIQKLQFSVDTLTKFEEKIFKNEIFVRWGESNLFVNYLYDLMDYSPIHNACVRSKVDNAVGAGYVNDYRINTKQTLNDVARQMFFEFIVTGNLFLEVVWKNDRSEGIAGFYIIPSKYMRAHKPLELAGEVTKYLYCRDWAQWKKSGIVEFCEFDPKNYTDRQIVHIRNFQPGYDYYGAPDYLSTINDIRLNHEITVYNLANLINGANPSLWVHFNVQAPDSQFEQETILKNIENRYKGADNAGRVIVSYGEASERPEITQISSNLQQGFYQEVFELVQKQILSGHKIIDGSLIGLPSPGGFNSSAEQLETAYKLFMNTSIRPLQNYMNRELQPIVQLIYPNEQVNLELIQNTII
jgi:phage portal protein BeeE